MAAEGERADRRKQGNSPTARAEPGFEAARTGGRAAPPPDFSTGQRARAWLVSWVAMNVVWQLLIAAWNFRETLVGLVASAIAATAIEAVREQGFVAFRPELSYFVPVLKAPFRTVVETAALFRLVWRSVAHRQRFAGRFYTVPLKLPDDPPRAAAKRALFTIGESISPNAYVVGYDEKTEVALMHELLPRGRRT